MKRFYLLALMVASLFYVACGDSDEVDNIEPTPNPPTPPAEVKVDTPQNVSAMDGHERVKICWKVNTSSEVKVTKTLLYTGANNSYKEYPVTSNGECEAVIDKLEEGEHTFQLANRDNDGNESAKVTISAKAYGEEYISELESRPIVDWEYVKKEKKLIITWQDDWNKGLGTEVYLPNADSEGTWIENDENVTEIESVEEGADLEIRTSYQPDNCFDILYAEPYSITPVADIIPVADPTDVKSMDGYKRVKIMWSNDPESTVVKTVIYWNERESHEEVAVSPDGMQENEIIIDELTEGDYSFEVVNYDEDGQQSNAVSVTAKAYGEEYVSELESRPIVDWEYVKKEKKLIITWQDDWYKGLGTEVYLPNADSEGTWIENDENVTEIEGVEEGIDLEIRTSYQPDNCFDILYAEPYSITPIDTTPPSSSTLEVRVMQLNVATGNALTALTGVSHLWSDRVKKIAAMIKDNNIDIIGLQELRDSPNYYYSDIISQLGSSYSGVCYARSSSYDKEGLAIVYRNDKFELVSQGRYWLNMQNPDQELILNNGGYAANYFRIAVYTILREKSTGQEFYFTTAHLDNNDAGNGIIKTWQAQILINHTNARSGYDKGENRFLIVTGDMNSNPEREAMQRFTSSTQNYKDTWTEAEDRHYPSSNIPRSTMVDIDGSTATQNAACFDYIYVKGGNPRVLSHTIHEAKSGGIIMSDHNAVSAVLRYEITK